MLAFMIGPMEVGVILVLTLVCFIPVIFYLLMLQKALSRCAPHNRAQSPEMVWLQLIPFFGMAWNFVNVIRVSRSLENEFRDRGINIEPDPGKSLGMAMAICMAVSVIPFIGSLASIAGLICWILYWVKIAGYSEKLAAPAMPQAAYQQPVGAVDPGTE